MDAPPDKGEDVRPFLSVAAQLHRFGYSAPQVLAADSEAGFLLLEAREFTDDELELIVGTSDAVFEAFFRAAREEGLLIGVSSALSLRVALDLAAEAREDDQAEEEDLESDKGVHGPHPTRRATAGQARKPSMTWPTTPAAPTGAIARAKANCSGISTTISSHTGLLTPRWRVGGCRAQSTMLYTQKAISNSARGSSTRTTPPS